MIFKIDKYGVISRIDNGEEKLTQGSLNVNKINLIVEEFKNTDDYLDHACTFTFTKDGAILLSNASSYVSKVEYEEKNLPCYTYVMNSPSVMNENGNVTMTARVFDYDSNDNLTQLYSTNAQLTIYGGVVDDTQPTITTEDYDKLLLTINAGDKVLNDKIDENVSKLTRAIDDEVMRAETEEGRLNSLINTNTKSISTNAEAISAETSRATQKESDLSVAIEAEKERALKAETNIREIAQGKTTSYPFNTKAEMDEWLSHEENTSKLNIGDEFYIIAPDEPDYWWDGTQAQPESNKIDLSGYATIDYVNEHINLALESDY